MQKPSVYIAIPTIRNGIVPQLVMNLIAWTHDDRYEIKINVPEGLQPADNARNTIVQDFLKTDCDYLWWIDDDIIPPPNTLCELVNTLLLRDDIDALSAVGFCMRADNGNYFPYPVTLKLDDKDKYTVYYGNDIEEVDAVGSGCVMVRRKVYKDVKRPYISSTV